MTFRTLSDLIQVPMSKTLETKERMSEEGREGTREGDKECRMEERRKSGKKRDKGERKEGRTNSFTPNQLHSLSTWTSIFLVQTNLRPLKSTSPIVSCRSGRVGSMSTSLSVSLFVFIGKEKGMEGRFSGSVLHLNQKDRKTNDLKGYVN